MFESTAARIWTLEVQRGTYILRERFCIDCILTTTLQQVNPSLLYWQRVDSNATPKDRSTARTHQPNPTVQGQEQREGPRPPSYLSDDGVEYVVSAEPRNTVYLPQPTDDIHPAYRDCLGPV